MGRNRSLFVFLDSSGSLWVLIWVLIGPYASLWVLIGPYRSLYVITVGNVFL